MRNLPKPAKIAILAGAFIVAVTVPMVILSGGDSSNNGPDGEAIKHSQTATDAKGDMSMPSQTSVDFVPAPKRLVTDITNTAISHDEKTLSVKVSFTDLEKDKNENQAIEVYMTTDQGLERFVSLRVVPAIDFDGIASVSSFPKWADDSKLGSPALAAVLSTCDLSKTPQHKVDYEANTMEVTVDRACLGNPEWVQFQVVASVNSTDGMKSFFDDGLNTKPFTLGDQINLPTAAPSVAALGTKSDKLYRPDSVEASDKQSYEAAAANPLDPAVKDLVAAIEKRAKEKKTVLSKQVKPALDAGVVTVEAGGIAPGGFYLAQAGWCAQGKVPTTQGGEITVEGPKPGQIVVSPEGKGTCLFDQ